MDRVSLRQFILLTFLLGMAMKMFNLPVLMLRMCGKDAFATLVAELGIDLVLLALVVCVVVLSGGKSFYELLAAAFGRPVSRIVALVAAAFWLIKLYFMLVDVRLFFSNTVFPADVDALHLIPLIALLAYFATRSLSGAGRLAEVLTPFVVIGMLVLGILTLPHADLGGLRPVLADGGAGVIKGVRLLPVWFGDFTLLLALCGKADGGKKLAFSLIAAAVAFAGLTVLSAVLFASYGDVPYLLSYGHSISSIAQYSVGSFRFGRMDLVVFCLWLGAVLLSAGMMAVFVLRSLEYAVGWRAGRVIAAAGAVALFVLMAVTVNLNLATEFAMVYFALPAAIVQYGLPVVGLVAIVVCKIKGKIHEKNKRKDS